MLSKLNREWVLAERIISELYDFVIHLSNLKYLIYKYNIYIYIYQYLVYLNFKVSDYLLHTCIIHVYNVIEL